MKKCKKCNKVKSDDEFYGFYTCKECYKKRVREYRVENLEKIKGYDQDRHRNNIDRIFRHRYSGMKTRVNGNNSHKSSVEGKAILSQSEFLKWCYKKENITVFLKLYENWKKSGYSNKMAPSIDRIKNNKGYTVENLQWLTLSDNTKKNDRKI